MLESTCDEILVKSNGLIATEATPQKLSSHNEKDAISIDLLTVNNIFPIVSTKERRLLTEVSKINPAIKLEISKNREFKTLSGHHVVISGPVLGSFDHTMSSILIALYFEKGNHNGGVLETTFKELREKLNLPKSGSVTNQITRSINRLKSCTFSIYQGTEQLWGRSIIKDWVVEGSGRSKLLTIELNKKWILERYCNGDISVQELPALAGLRGDYAPSLYRLLTTGKKKSVEIPIKYLWEYLTIKDSKSKPWNRINTTTKSNFRREVKNGIAKLQKSGLADLSSKIVGESCILVKSKELLSQPTN